MNEMLVLDRYLLKSHLYTTFVLPQTTEQNDLIHAIEVEIIHETVITTKILLYKTVIALHPEIDLVMTKVFLLHNKLDHDMTTITIILEVHMYHPTEMANAVTPTSWFYSLYTHTPSNQSQREYPSRFEISFLLQSCMQKGFCE